MNRVVALGSIQNHPAKLASEFKVGDKMVMNHGTEFTVLKIEKKDDWINFSLVGSFGNKSIVMKKHDSVIGFKKGKK